VALEGLVIVARRSANTATAQPSSAADTDAHTALQVRANNRPVSGNGRMMPVHAAVRVKTMRAKTPTH
jgi:hypothetical protein